LIISSLVYLSAFHRKLNAVYMHIVKSFVQSCNTMSSSLCGISGTCARQCCRWLVRSKYRMPWRGPNRSLHHGSTTAPRMYFLVGVQL